MDNILIIAICVLFVVLVIAVVVIVNYFKNDSYRRKDVHISGGVNVETGQISSDNNYFKGISGTLEGTVVVGYDYRQQTAFSFTVHDINKSRKTTVQINDNIIIGRLQASDVYSITDDNMVSKKHCKLYIQDNRLWLCDMGSRNHTFINGRMITSPVECKSGDVITIGKTMLSIIY